MQNVFDYLFYIIAIFIFVVAFLYFFNSMTGFFNNYPFMLPLMIFLSAVLTICSRTLWNRE